MTRLPVELIDEILALAVDLGIIRASEVSRICTRWRYFQRLLFRSVPLDPFETDILDLTLPQHRHLTSYIEEVRVIPRLATCPPPHDQNQDLSPSFTNFICSLTNPRGIFFHDTRVKWTSLSTSSRNSLLTALQCNSFRRLAVLTDSPLPPWILSSALILTITCIGPPVLHSPFTGSITHPCSLTHLVLASDLAIQQMATFCIQQPDSAKTLLGRLDHLGLEYNETHLEPPTIVSFIKELIVFSGTQLKVLDLDIKTRHTRGHTSLPISASAFCHLDSLQQLNLRLIGISPRHNALQFAMDYMPSFLQGLPVSSPITLLSLRVKVARPVSHGDTMYSDDCPTLFRSISRKLASDEWRYLTSASILVDVKDRSRAPAEMDDDVTICAGMPELKTLVRITHPQIVANVPWVRCCRSDT